MTASRGIRIKRGTRIKWAEQQRGKHFCQCGCGEPILVGPQHYPHAPRYRLGHNNRVEPSRIAGVKPKPKPCECGCGKPARPGRRFLSGHNSRGRVLGPEERQKIGEKMKGRRNHRFGKRPHNYVGRQRRKDGYIAIPSPDHPFAGKKRIVMEHRLVMEAYLRESDPQSPWLVKLDGELYLKPTAEVHHVDGDKANNAIENLEVMSKADHARLHLHAGC